MSSGSYIRPPNGRRSSPLPVNWRAGPEHRRSRCRQPDLEADRGRKQMGASGDSRHLRDRAASSRWGQLCAERHQCVQDRFTHRGGGLTVSPRTSHLLATLADLDQAATIAAAVAELRTHFDMIALQLGYVYEDGALLARPDQHIAWRADSLAATSTDAAVAAVSQITGI